MNELPLYQKIANTVTIWGFGSSVVTNAASIFLQTDVAKKTVASSTIDWNVPLGYGAFGLLMIAVVSWVISFISQQTHTSRRFSDKIDAEGVIPEITRPLTPIPVDRHDSPGVTRARELMDLCAGRTSVEVGHISSEHAGEPIEVSGLVYNVNSYGDASANISIELDPTKPGLIHAPIVDKDQIKRATSLRKGDKVKVSGKIVEIVKDAISLTDCEFTRF